MDESQLWYVRRHDKQIGPYPAGLIRRFLLLQRLVESDEVSTDGEQWVALSTRADLIPEVMKVDRDDPVAQERLSRARRWADERSSADRRMFEERGGESKREQRSNLERRAPSAEPSSASRPRQATQRHHKRDGYVLGALFIAAVVASVGGYLMYYQPKPPEALADCTAPPAPRVNWSNCRMEGAVLARADLTGANLGNADFSGGDFHGSAMVDADLSYAVMSIADLRGADLSRANLKGISLRGADLAHANLSGADLSYADLQGANLVGVTLGNTRFDHAIWVDRAVCTAGSVDQCLVASGN